MLTLQLPVTSPAHGQLHRRLHTSAAVTGTWMGPTQVRNVVIITFAVSPVLSLQSHSLTFLSFSFLPKSPPTEWRCAGGRTGSPASCGLGEARPASRRLRSSPASYGLGELPGRWAAALGELPGELRPGRAARPASRHPREPLGEPWRGFPSVRTMPRGAAEQPSSPAIRHCDARWGWLFFELFCIFVVSKIYVKSLSPKSFIFVDKRF
jgi:hypothetical protein